MGLGSTLVHTATMPARIGLAAGELGLEVALGVVRGTRRALEGDHGSLRGYEVSRTRVAEPATRSRRAAASNGASATPTKPRGPAPAAPPPPPAAAQGDTVPVMPPPPGAKEVDDSPVPIAEFGGEGADDAAGAEVRVDPPWEGYDDMTAAQIQQRLADAEREAVAAVLLYEGTRRDRRSVLKAADRRLRLLSA